MKFFNCTIISFILFIITGCNPSIEKRIEKSFFEYADKNLADPESIECITSISLSDSSDVEKLFSMVNKIVNDSTVLNYDVDGDYILNKIKHLSYEKKYQTKYYAEKYIDKSIEFLQFKISNDNEIKYLKDSINSYISKISKENYDHLYTYEIKVRIKEKGEKRISSYYAIIDTNDNIKIQDHKLKIEEVPILNEIYDTINQFISLRDKYSKQFKELKEAERDFLIRL